MLIIGFEKIIGGEDVETLEWRSDTSVFGHVTDIAVLDHGADVSIVEFSLKRRKGESAHLLAPNTAVPLALFMRLIRDRRAETWSNWTIDDGDVVSIGVRNPLKEEQRFCAALAVSELVSAQLLWWANINTGALVRPLSLAERNLSVGDRSHDQRAVVVHPHTYEGFDGKN